MTSAVTIALATTITLLLSVRLSEINRQTAATGSASSISAVSISLGIPAWFLYRYMRGLI